MHRLYRDSKAPRCLSRYRHGVAVWTINSPNNAERAEIWDKLHAMQGLRCAYVQTAESFAELASQFSEDEWLPLLQEEIKKTAHLPFATAIRHVLTRVHAND